MWDPLYFMQNNLVVLGLFFLLLFTNIRSVTEYIFLFFFFIIDFAVLILKLKKKLCSYHN